MKIQFTLVVFFLLSIYCFGQNCSPTTSVTQLNANNCKVTLPNGGDLFWNRANAGYAFPNSGQNAIDIHAIFAGGFWISGFDPASNLKVTAQNYGTAFGQVGFFAGPTSDLGQTDLESCILWDRHFSVRDEDIVKFRNDLSDGSIDDPIPFSIQGWPGRENPLFVDVYEFDLPNSTTLAPFFDENGDGVYNPNDGDYPNTKGADQAIWWIMNDLGNVTQFDPVGMMVSVLALSYEDENEALNNSTIYDVRMQNVKPETIELATFSLWIDPELGCFTDDYVGCLQEENLAFIYNMDAIDGDNGCQCPLGVNTYCNNIPVMGIKLLKGPLDNDGVEIGLSSFLTFENAAFGTNPIQQAPTTASEYANFMQGFWRDGSPMIHDGEIISHQYSGNPADGEAHTMCSENVTSPDKRMLLNFGTFDLPPGGVNELSFAITGIESVAHPCPDMTELVQLTNELKEIYNEGIVSDVQVVSDSDQAHDLKVFPNPMNSSATFKLKDSIAANGIINSISINALDGKVLLEYQDINAKIFDLRDISLPNGVYFYKAQVSSKKIYTGKLVILK